MGRNSSAGAFGQLGFDDKRTQGKRHCPIEVGVFMFKWEVLDVEPRTDYTLLITFANGKKRLFDCKKNLLNKEFAAPLRNMDFFMQAKADHYTVVWADDFDVAPEYLYDNSVKVK